jgi:glycosyltransferase involved in cell wall biosynthesis
MKIAIDAHMLGDQEGGNETYVTGILKGFEQLSLGKQAEITALYNPNYKILAADKSKILTSRYTTHNNFHRLFVETAYICRNLQIDLLHATYNVSPFIRLPYVVTVHDVIFRLYPQYFSPRVRLLLTTLMPVSMWRARIVITVSETSKRDIIQFYPFTRNKIVVTHEAGGPIVNVQGEPTVVDKYTQGKEFILTVGTVQPRKNIARLVQAYIILRQLQITTARLVIVGRSQWQGSEIQQIAAGSMYSHDIIFTGYLDDAAVAALYQACAVFIYPSLYEGFGLPLLEAMSFGAPVITSNTSSLPEVAGDAALLIDPLSIEQITDALKRILTDPNLSENLRMCGRKRASQFTWQRTALETLEAYKLALNML